jgi:hypothetical protein
MKTLVFAAVALLAGCAGLQPSSGAPGGLPQRGNATGFPPLWVQRDMALAMPHYEQRPMHADHGSSWMLPQKKGVKSALIYEGDYETNDVYVYDYSSGKLVGTLTGFEVPFGMCVDAKGDIYISNSNGGGTVEYAHGGTKVLNTYDTGPGPIGCSVDAKGDVAVTNFDYPGEVTVFSGGDPSKGTPYSGACYYMWPMGYDHSGNLIGVGKNASGGVEYCALLSGGKSITLVSASGFTIDFPGGTMWDGKYIALADQEADGENQTGIVEATLSGSTLTSHGEAILSCNPNSGFDLVNPFVVGKKNTPVNNRRGKVVVGPGCSGIGFWHYPKGGNPLKSYGNDNSSYDAVVSLGT